MPRPVRLALGSIVAFALSALAPAGAGAGGWEPPVFALNGTGNAISHPSVAVDDAGNVYAAWIEGGLMEVSKRPVGGVFETPQTLDPGVSASSNPDIGVDGAGNAVVVWTETVNVDTHTIRQATRAAGTSSFGTPSDVNTGAPSAKDNPKLAVNRAGEAVLAIQTPTSGVGIARVFLGTATGGFTSPFTEYSEGPNTSIFRPDAAINEAGDAVVVWRAFSSGSHRMHAVYRPRGRAFGPAPEDVALPSSTQRFDPSVAIDSQGRAMAVWDEGGAGAVRSFERGAGASGSWTSVSDLDTQQSGAAVPVVAYGLFDDALAAWNGFGDLRISRRAPGGAFSSPPQSNFGSASQIAIDGGPEGGAVFTWTTGGANPIVAGSTFFTNTFGSEVLSPSGHGGSATDVAMGPSGNAAAVWIDTNPAGQNPRLVTAEYDVTPPKFTATSFELNPTAGQPAAYSALATDDWSQPFVAWTFGPAQSAMGAKVMHTYPKPGTYLANVGALDGAGNQRLQPFTVKVAPPPKRGVSFNASEVSGTVRVSVRRKNGSYAPFRRLGPNDNIPIGSIIDATHGVAQIETATNKSGTKTQRGKFSQGVFKTQQSKGSALATAVLLGGGNFRKQCKPFGFLAKRRRPHRRLFGNVHGRFRTRGRHSAATVRGTKWLTQDTCSGTLTVVSRGRVSVLDFGTHKTKLVRAGHRYLARSRRK